jgi:VWFA-related protein
MLKKVILLAALATSAVAQQQAPFGEKVDVNLVMLDAIVTDKRGNQILGLDKPDFVVTEDGVQQNVDSVEYFTNRTLLTAPEKRAEIKVERIRSDRYYIFFFDKPPDMQLFDRLVLARRSVENFVDKQMKPGDMVAIVAHDVRLKVLSDFTSDKKQLKRAIDQSATFARGLVRAEPSTEGPSLLKGIGADMIDGTGTVYQALRAIGEGTRNIHARKELVLFSVGIVEPGEQIQEGIAIGESRYYDPMIRSLNQANVAVYPINLLQEPNQPPVVHQTLTRIASETNGDYFRFNTSFSPALKRIEAMTSGYYLVSYYTRHPRGASGFQKVSLKLRNPDFRVRARQGYSFGQ